MNFKVLWLFAKVSKSQEVFCHKCFPLYGIAAKNYTHWWCPICGPIVNIIWSHATLLVLQATPFAERGRVWSRCNYRVVAENAIIEHSG